MKRARAAPQVLVLGLDGASLELIRRWAAEGSLPTLARLLREGTSGELLSTIPPVTAPAWISFMTGRGPAHHGVFQFRTYDLSKYTSYNETLVTSRAFAGTTIFDLAGAAGRRVAAVNVPMTYPPFPVNGVMISGYPTPNVQKAYAYPPQLARDVGLMNVSGEFFRHSNRERIRSATYMVENLTALTLRLLEQEGFDLVTVVYTNTDMANHFFRKYMDPSLPVYDARGARRYGSVLRDQYVLCDQAAARLLARTDEETTVIVMSDHGSGPYATQYLHLNAWLRQRGLLALRASGAARSGEGLREMLEFVRIRTPFLREFLKRSLPNRIKEWISWGRQNAGAIDWRRTVAYRVPMAFHVDGINLNLRGRQAQGIVEPAGYQEVRETITQALSDLRDPRSGAPLVTRVLRKEEAFPVGDSSRAPDLIVFFDPRYAGGSGVAGPVVTPIPRYFLKTWSGQHMMEGTFIAWGPHIRRGHVIEGAQIIDVAPTILHLLNLPVPEDMDGRVLTEMFEPAYLAAYPPRVAAATGEGDGSRHTLTPEEEREMREALRALGYLS